MPISTRKGSAFVADSPVFESPVVARYERGSGPLTLRDVSGTNKLIVRADDDTHAAAQMDVPFGASRSDGESTICGIRPHEWIVLGTAAGAEAILESLDRDGHVSVIDYTHSRALFELSGADSARVLEKVCGLDLCDDMTPHGAVFSASVAKVTCDLVRRDVNGELSYLIACDRSLGQYLFDALLDAGSEFDLVPT